MHGASFSDLKQKRKASETASATVVRKVHTIDPDSSLATYESIDKAFLEIRETTQAGRTLYAKKTFEPGTTLLRVSPHVRLLDNAHLPVICARCMRDVVDPKRCSACKAVYYCSSECQRADWKPDRHKLECQKLQDWAKRAKAAGRPAADQLPSTPIRALGRLILLKSLRDANWWQEVASMAQSPIPPSAEEREHLGSLALAVTQYLVGQSSINALFPGMDAQQITQTLLALVDQFGINSFSLTMPDLTNIGVAICPTIALINHSCDPNCTVVFPDGPDGDMQVVAFKRIEEGEEVLSSYVDITMPLVHRRAELLKQYKFHCECRACSEAVQSGDKRQAYLCGKKGCLGALPFPDVSIAGNTAKLTCPLCKSSKTVQLGEKGEAGNVGLRWALKEAEFQLGVKDPEAFHSLPHYRQAVFSMVIQQLSFQDAHPGSDPLLALHRLGMERALADQDFGKAREYAQQIKQGLESIFSPGHPVRAVHEVVLGRLMSISNTGGEVQDDLVLIMAYEQLKRALVELKLGFGTDGILFRDVSKEIAQLEMDLSLRKRLRAP